jgi:hypothetical protein
MCERTDADGVQHSPDTDGTAENPADREHGDLD